MQIKPSTVPICHSQCLQRLPYPAAVAFKSRIWRWALAGLQIWASKDDGVMRYCSLEAQKQLACSQVFSRGVSFRCCWVHNQHGGHEGCICQGEICGSFWSSPVQSSTSTFVQVAPYPAIVTNTIFTAVAIKNDPNIWAFNIQGIICKPSAS